MPEGPYGFVRIPVDGNGVPKSLAAPPVFHDGRPTAEKLLSGEMLCTLTALTPLIVANDQYPAEEADGAAGPDRHGKVTLPPTWGVPVAADKDKQIIEPLRLKDGCVAIAGTGLKGMLRQSLGALLAAPMERVAERSFSYRPNIALATRSVRRAPRPAVVESWTPAPAPGVLRLKILGAEALTNIIFVENEAFARLAGATAGMPVPRTVSGVRKIEVKTKKGVRIYWRLEEDPAGTETFDHVYFPYAGGMDGTGDFAQAFVQGGGAGTGKVYHHVLVHSTDCAHPTSKAVPAKILAHHDKTVEHLCNEVHGHLRAEHPLSKRIKGARKENIIRGIGASRDVIRTPNQLIYVEVELDLYGNFTITSLGQNFRYRWRYADTVRSRWTAGSMMPRPLLLPLADERAGADQRPAKLSAARLLLGYVGDDKNEGVKGIGAGAFRQLAGRLAFNIAVEQCDDGQDDARFLSNGQAVPLKILGAPKPSAVETYLDLSQLAKRQNQSNDRGKHVTYGDVPGELVTGELAGRKFYRHKPAASNPINHGCYRTADPEVIAGNQAVLARFVSKPGATFKFALRFRDLRFWELGAVLACFDPKQVFAAAPASQRRDDLRTALANAQGDGPDFALKLGRGRPLGLGSVTIKVDALRLLDGDYALRDGRAAGEERQAIEAFGHKLAACDPEAIADWLTLHRYRGVMPSGYPSLEAHTDERRGHAKGRRERRQT